MSKSVLIVESHNDKFFIERLLRHLNIQSALEVSNPICSIDDYECLGGFSPAKLVLKLNEVRIKIEKDDINKIGVLLDADQVGIAGRVAMVNQAVIEAGFTNVVLAGASQWCKCVEYGVDLSCHVQNLNGHGELETVLKAIVSKDTTYADCLSRWRDCLAESNKSISDKDFDKFWVNIYQRYDQCSKREQNHAVKKCSLEASLDKDIWDFDHTCLEELKAYLKSFV